MNTKEIGKLMEKVRAGRPDAWYGCGYILGAENGELFYSSYLGSLDSVRQLHESLLPGWYASFDLDGRAYVSDYAKRVFETKCMDNPVRAWLISILKALEEGCYKIDDI